MNRTTIATALAATVVLAACGDDGSDRARAVTLVAYESFPTDDPDDPHPVQLALDEFTDETGIEVEVLIAGDTGTMLSKAVLTAGNPEGDVMWGVDNTFLSRALEADVFEPYVPDGIERIPSEFTDLVPGGEATPVDFGDVCVNYDVAALDAAGLEPPTDLDQLADPEYAGRLVVQNPATSSPGLAFLLATVAEFGSDWEAFWSELDSNGVAVVDGWTQAYYERFSLAGGDRPLVVSYGSSPPFEVLAAAEPPDEAPTAVVEATCFRQVEFAGVLRGTDAPDEARRLMDFLISERFQREVPLNLFVFPANQDVELDQAFVDHATIAAEPLTVDPALIDERRSEWIDRWTEIVAG
ncbi:MAG: thiamine ABC transporter substrate-binding protein [Ilumatobacter sp.]|uniref:thiamine ABC transporter substrate-binding protein n=1 Tax=Ilumatobacter sp. TaxID=1967498 RepID=UPI002617EECE|nr:thiamine ABC transporter substrate-binding protein [Ilumatobacter sp.]MDJ0767655.1 thiamine ABC transporter substrate-binding protein [Ilumatobacter sp.]